MKNKNPLKKFGLGLGLNQLSIKEIKKSYKKPKKKELKNFQS